MDYYTFQSQECRIKYSIIRSFKICPMNFYSPFLSSNLKHTTIQSLILKSTVLEIQIFVALEFEVFSVTEITL